jgi:hypothetical protein
MNFLLYKILNHKKYIVICMLTIFFISFCFGLYINQYSSNEIKSFFQTLFVLNKEQNYYQIYLLQNLFIIFITTYLNTHYFGSFIILFILFLKGIQFAFSFIYIFNTISFTPSIVISLICQCLIECVFLIIAILPNILLSLQSLIITFIQKEIFDYKNIFNYKLNIIISLFIIFFISLLIKIYLLNII